MLTKPLETTFPITIAEDDEDDYMLIIEALKEAGIGSNVSWVKDGEELMDSLNEMADFQEKAGPPHPNRPSLILLDLNMPRKDGREALQEIKAHQMLRKIPVVVLTTSKSETDIDFSYELGVNSFIQKPVRFAEFVEMVKVLSQYWFSVVKLPS